MKKIMFVCSGNTCRSPLAEGIARKILSDRIETPVDVSSAGSMASEGMPASPHAVSVASFHGMDLANHRSRLLNTTSVADADLIVAMGRKHRDTVGIIDPDALSYTILMTEFCEEVGDVPDPIGGSMEEYERIYEIINRCMVALAGVLDDYDGWKSARGSADGEMEGVS